MTVFYFALTINFAGLFFPLFYGLNVYTISILLLMIVLCIAYYLNFSAIHWEEIEIKFYEKTITINGQILELEDLESYEFRRASVMSGDRTPLHLQFSNAKFLFHPPKKSPSVQENYDHFVDQFNDAIKELKLGGKQKILSKAFVIGMGVLCLIYLIVMIYMTVVYGSQLLRSLLPPFFLCISTFGALAGIRTIQLQQRNKVTP
ncbi:hypothetical protein [Flammeovirga aprica]|uniref:Uncharacterized protein n=1 Tax=Flammeovirga aprica JL-4 TaxID=694437 RepID=A0A7X9RZ65_9BACT|nr:hypothetical protein [Flammeovirga aprica]NME71375.1 hypothetical protein [Flammeovirga aprica JL-4]